MFLYIVLGMIITRTWTNTFQWARLGKYYTPQIFHVNSIFLCTTIVPLCREIAQFCLDVIFYFEYVEGVVPENKENKAFFSTDENHIVEENSWLGHKTDFKRNSVHNELSIDHSAGAGPKSRSFIICVSFRLLSTVVWGQNWSWEKNLFFL